MSSVNTDNIVNLMNRIAELELTNIDQGLLIAKQHNRIAELEAECKENGTALNRTLLVLRDAQVEIVRLEAENERLQALAEKAWKQADDANNAGLKSALRIAELEAHITEKTVPLQWYEALEAENERLRSLVQNDANQRIAELETSIESKSDIINRLYNQIESMEKRIAELDEALENSLTDCQDCMAEQDKK